MSLIKGIIGKVDDFIINGLCRCFRNTLCHRTGNALRRIAVNEHLSLFFDDFHLLFGNRTTDIICLAHGIAAQGLEDGDNLLLIDDTAVGNLQNRLQKRCLIANFSRIQLIGDKHRNGIHRTGSVQCYNSGQIFNGGGPHIYTHTGDTGGLQLENALSLTLSQHCKGFRIIIRNFADIKTGIQFLNFLLSIFNHRQVAKAQKVHLQQTQFLNGGHCVLSNNGIVVPG